MSADQIPLMQKDISMLTDKIDKVEVKLDRMSEKLENMLTKMEDKYAWKWTEKVLVYVWWLMLTAIIWSIMTLIIIK